MDKWFWICVFLHISSAYGDDLIEICGTVTEDIGSYTYKIDENNHDFNSFDDISVCLLIITSTTAPDIKFSDKSFLYEVLPTENTNKFNLYAKETFDYESGNTQYKFMISPPDIQAILNIKNVDDESPSIANPNCEFEENKLFNATSGHCTVLVKDPDGWLADMKFELDSYSDIFVFEFASPPDEEQQEADVSVTVIQALDYETVNFYSFLVTATDGAGHNTTPSDTVRALISVTDVNDTPPEWTQIISNAQIPEEKSQSFQVKAVDGDKGMMNTIAYKITSEDDCEYEKPCVTVDDDGLLTVNKIDRDAKDIQTFAFQVLAYEKDTSEGFNVSLDVTLYIEDIDDNSPMVEENPSSRTTSIDENSVGTLDISISIKDIDTGENAQFSVEIEDNDFSEAFMVVPTIGYRQGNFGISIINSAKLDYETPEWREITFDVVAKGKVDQSKLCRLTINVNLNDLNDEVPVFEPDSFSGTVKETIAKDAPIIQVMATDADENDTIVHSLIKSPITDLIRIDSDSGIVYVDQENAFDYDRVNPIFFQVQAEDLANHTTVVPVTITLTDVNNKAPSIYMNSTIEVEENQKNGTTLNGLITASDVDEDALLTAQIIWDDSYAKKNFRTLDSNNATIKDQIRFFELNQINSGGTHDIQISFKTTDESEKKPDFEVFDSLYLVIEVTDENTDADFLNQKSTKQTILISIVDVNDNEPVFDENSLTNLKAKDKDTEKTMIGTIIATDDDVTDKVTYSCTAKDASVDWFNFDSTSGVITAKTLINVDGSEIYDVVYDCSASDMVHTTHYDNVNIQIDDVNDQTPVINSNDVITTKEEQSEGTTVIIDTTDDDRDENYKTVQCRISKNDATDNCKDNFTITLGSNELSFQKKLDRDYGPAQYRCLIECYDDPDGGDVHNSAEKEIQIVLTDINDNAPELVTQELNTLENTQADTIIDEISANDIDEGNNALVSFTIIKIVNIDSGEEKNNLFEIFGDPIQEGQQTTIQLAASTNLQTLYGEYNVYLKLNDNPDDGATKENTGELLVKVGRWNYNAPKFVFPDGEKYFIFASKQSPGQQLQMFERVENNADFPNIQIYNENDQCTDKWDTRISVKQKEPVDDNNPIFTIVVIDRCTAQLQITNNYDVETALQTNYTIEITTTLLNDREYIDGEASYEATLTIHAQFLDNALDPIFPEPRTWSVRFFEDDDNQKETLPDSMTAFYKGLSNQPPIYYYLIDKEIKEKFILTEADEHPTLSLREALNFDEDESFSFQILATNETNGISESDESYLTVDVEVIDINNHPPQWTKPSFVQGITTATSQNTIIITVDATDADKIDDQLHYTLLEDTLGKFGNNLDSITSPFKMNGNTGDISMNFRLESTMSGYFTFDVQVMDNDDGHAVFTNTTSVTILILTTDYSIDFKFENPLEEVLPKETEMLEIIGNEIGYNCYVQIIQKDSENGVELDNQTLATLFFINEKIEPIKADEIRKIISDISKFTTMRSELRKQGLILLNFDTEEVAQNLESTLKAWLIGITITLGGLLLIVLIFFIIKIRQLTRRLTNLTTQKFGSEESGLNRIGVNVPTTNQHAVEGSNPVFSNDVVKRDFSKDFDQDSINSGDSELIGVEDNAEFDHYNRLQNETSQYI